MSRKSRRKPDPLDAKIEPLARLPGVASVYSEVHYGDELVIFVELASLPNEHQQVQWQQRFYAFMSEHFLDQGRPFTDWAIIVQHGGVLLDAGARKGDEPDQFCQHCQLRQDSGHHECIYCLQPFDAA